MKNQRHNYHYAINMHKASHNRVAGFGLGGNNRYETSGIIPSRSLELTLMNQHLLCQYEG